MGSLCLGLVLLLVLGIGGLYLYVRYDKWRFDRAFMAVVRGYVESHGATVSPEGELVRVRGALGEGVVSLKALRVVCGTSPRDNWEFSIEMHFRAFIPDRIHHALARADAQERAEVGPQLLALPEDALRARLRVQILRAGRPVEGLVTCARPLGDGFEARVGLDGIALSGLPAPVRARLSETDEALFATALSQTLGAAPQAEDGAVRGPGSMAWLLRADEIFGATPTFIAACGEGLAWTGSQPAGLQARLHALCRRSADDGPLRASLWVWDGLRLHGSTIALHTIRGPDTPDFTIGVPAALHPLLGIVGATNDRIGIYPPR